MMGVGMGDVAGRTAMGMARITVVGLTLLAAFMIGTVGTDTASATDYGVVSWGRNGAGRKPWWR